MTGYRFPPQNTVYNILGSTTALPEAQMKSIMAGRRRIVELAKQNTGYMYVNGPAAERSVALTFDDGPDSSVTPEVLDILKANNAKGNFFFTGTQIEYFPRVVRRAYDEGHLILNHSLDHPHFSQMNLQGIKKQIISTEERMKSIIGKKPSLLRPPYGETDERVLSAARETRNKIIIWSDDSMDWVPGIQAQNVVQNVLSNLRPGEIILMHTGSGQRKVLEALPQIIRGIRARGFSIVDLGEMLDIAPYKE